MTPTELTAIIEGLVPELTAAIDARIKTVADRVVALEGRTPVDGKDGRDGRDGLDGKDGRDAEAPSLESIAVAAAALIPIPKDGANGIDGKDGRDAEAPSLESIAVAAAALIPIPKDGANGIDGKDGKDGANGQDGEPGYDGKDGKDADPLTPELVLEAMSASPALLQKAVETYIAAHPPINGKDGSDGLNGKDGAAGVDGKDGQDGKPGRDGQPGISGRDGKDGEKGADGLDGLGFDDIQVEHDGERSFSLKFVRGNREKSFGAFTIPSLIYRGVYQQGSTYTTGDCVTFGGSLFVAQTGTKAKPETNQDWKLAVKRGRDGQDVKK